MQEVVFIINPSLWYQNMYPTGILCLSAYLEEKGYKNTILDSKISRLPLEQPLREKALLYQIKKIKPKIVCFSSSHRGFQEVVKLNNEVKKISKNIFTIVGGSQPTYRASDFLENGFDFVCVGEGEKTLLEFVQSVYHYSNDWGIIKGLCWKEGEASRFNEKRELMSEVELNEIHNLPYHKIDRRFFEISIGTIRGLPLRGGLLLTSRGCPFSCSYCGCNLIFGRALRFKSAENIEAEVKRLKKNYGVEGLWIVDDTFTINENHAIKVAQILKKYQLVWGCQSRVDTINERLIKIMKDAGCVQIDFGVESGSQRILDKIIGKKTNIKQIIRAFDLCRTYQIRTLANFMIGLPTETYKDLERTKKIADLIRADIYIFAIAIPLPGTKLFEMVGEKITPEDYSSLDWNGSPLTEKLNKSRIKNLIQQKKSLEKKYNLRTMVKSFISWDNFLFFLKREHRIQRLKYILSYLKGSFSRQFS